MTDGITIKHLRKLLYDDTRRHIAETSGPAQNQSVRTYNKCAQISIPAIAATKHVRKPDAQTVTNSRALNGLTLLKLAASYTVR